MIKKPQRLSLVWFVLGLFSGICLTILFMLFWIQILTAIIIFVIIIAVIMWISPKVREIILDQLKIPAIKRKEKPKEKAPVREPCQFCGSIGKKHKKTCKLSKKKEIENPEIPQQT